MSFPRHAAALQTIKEALRCPVGGQAATTLYDLLGLTIDTRIRGLNSLNFAVIVGATSGTPDSFTVKAKLQDAVTGSGDWADVVADKINTAVAIETITAIDTTKFLSVDVTRLRPLVRLVFEVVFVNGTTPKISVSAVAAAEGTFQPAA